MHDTLVVSGGLKFPRGAFNETKQDQTLEREIKESISNILCRKLT